MAGAMVLLAATALGVVGYSARGEKVNPAYGQAMWKEVAVDTFFPATIQHKREPGSHVGGKEASWYRVAIAPDGSCGAGLSKRSEDLAAEAGCEAAPRATYVDASGNIVATVAVVVLKPGGDVDSRSVELAESLKGITNEFALVHALPAPGTPAARWNDEARNGAHAGEVASAEVPYVIAATTGSVDGRRAAKLPPPWSDDSPRHDRLPWTEAAEALASEVGLWLTDLALKGAKGDE
ncbi:hypothetical protein [Actinomadura sp. B10D3]|uniref:hypothetical protein n=1 Tax=Actinomadura sp. B10D3 TaxID=3153557 RepID=UPI00325EE110